MPATHTASQLLQTVTLSQNKTPVQVIVIRYFSPSYFRKMSDLHIICGIKKRKNSSLIFLILILKMSERCGNGPFLLFWPRKILFVLHETYETILAYIAGSWKNYEKIIVSEFTLLVQKILTAYRTPLIHILSTGHIWPKWLAISLFNKLIFSDTIFIQNHRCFQNSLSFG